MSEAPEAPDPVVPTDPPRPPTPARAGRDRPPSARPERAEGAEAESPRPSRDFRDIHGDPWRVEVAGLGRTGLRGEPHAELVLLLFHRDGEPGEDGGGSPLEVLAVAKPLEDLTDGDLDRLLAEARPLRPPRVAEEPARTTRRRSARD